MSRRYSYVIVNRSVSPGILHQGVTWVAAPLAADLMQAGAQCLMGNHDFAAFRAAECQAKSSRRIVHHIAVFQRGDLIILDVTANAFLQHMVRNITGTLIAVGLKKYPPSWVKEVLESKNRALAGITAPAQGLYLTEVSYPHEFQVPSMGRFPWFFSLWDDKRV